MPKRITIIDGHPDPEGGRLIHALVRAYCEGASAAGHELRRIEIASIDFPILRSARDWSDGAVPASLRDAQTAIAWAEHLLILYPLWLGDVPALLKGFFEQVMRPGFATRIEEGKLPEKLLKGRSARIVVTMGMPAFFYRFYFGAHSVRSLERNILGFVGIAPISRSFMGGVEADAERRAQWIEEMVTLGRAGL